MIFLCTREWPLIGSAKVERTPGEKYEYRLMTYPFCVNSIGTSMLCDDERRRSPAMSAKRAKSVSRSWSAKRGERRDSDKRTSSSFFTSSNGACSDKKEERTCQYELICRHRHFYRRIEQLRTHFARKVCQNLAAKGIATRFGFHCKVSLAIYL